MTEINTNHELLVVLTENAERSTPAPKSMPAPENDGGVLHRYGPRVEIRRTQPLAIGGTPLAVSPGPRGASGTLSFAEKLGIEAFTLRRSPDYRTAKANRPRDGESWDMRGCAPKAGDTPAVEALVSSMVMAPQSADGVARGSAPAPGAAMLVGSVAVGIIIVNGPNAMTQFTDSERVQVVAEVQAGLTWLGNQEPAAHITWNYEIHNVSIPTATDATADDDESRWRNPAMGSLGHTENWQGVIDYVNAMRARLQTNWAYCVFFVKGYPLWHFAYASAPRIVMDYTNDGWGPDNIDRVFAHETGHIFSCPDEYSAANCTCTSTHGIYDEPNSNCASCAPGGGTSCLMRANDWTMCLHTRRHLGWGPWRPWFSVPGQHVFDREKQQIAAVSRAPGNLDLFVIGFDNHIWTTFWNDAVGWNQEWFPVPGQHVFDREKQQIAAVSRAPGNLDLFVIGFDNHIWTTFWNDAVGWNQEWFPVPGQHVFDREKQQIAAVSRAPGNLDLFVIGFDNHIWTTFWNDAVGWNQEWFPVPGQHVFDREKQQIAAVSRAPGNLDLFVIGFDNHIWTTFWNDAVGWNQEWFPVPGQHVFDREKQQIAAVSRAPGNLDLFVIGFDNHIWTTFWNDAVGWNQEWFPVPGQHVFDREKQQIAAVSRAPGNLDLFVIGFDNHIWTTFWNDAVGWNQEWFPPLLGQHVFDREKQQVAAVSRAPGNLDLFVIGFDNHVWSAWWSPV